MKLSLDDVLFFLIRHGETVGNKKKIYRGWSNAPDAQLDPVGRKAASEAADFLLSINAPIELIICDTLDRVVETCEIIAQKFPDARMETVRDLHPLNMGEYTLKSKADHPVDPFLKDPTKKIPGGESVAGDFDPRQKRIFSLIFQIARDLPGGKILVGGHGSNIAYLYNRVFEQGETNIGYEGIVNPGGLVAVTEKGMIPLTRVKENSPEVEHPAPTYPPDHKPAMQVPKGGSSCASCEYLGEDGQSCTNKYFIAWNGSGKLPHPADEYCSDWYEPKEKL